MHNFETWAPFAKSISVSMNGALFPMHGPDEHGCWNLEVQDAVPGTDYGYIVNDDKTVYPDPRSQWQPNGVHGLSRVYDQCAFSWTDARFQPSPLSIAIIYELHVGTFTERGTLDAAIEKLDHLVHLGITHVELMPVASFAGNHGWGYDGVALFAVHQPYGGPDALKRLVDAAHAKGLAVLLDVVYNHFGPVGNYTSKFGPYVTDSHHTPWGGAVNLEESGAYQVRRFFCDNAQMWLRDFHIDGLRIDAIHAFVDRSAIHFLEQLSIEVESLSTALARNLVLIAESDLNDPRFVTPRASGGVGMDAQWNDDFHHALFTVLCEQPQQGYYTDFGSLAQLVKSLERTFVYDGIYSHHRGRIHGRAATHLSQHRFLSYIQNHDQVGNRAAGDRIAHIAGIGRAKIAAALVLTSPFIPMLFQGEEWAAASPFQYFADHEPDLARLVSEGRKREFVAFGWDANSIPDPEKYETFERSKLNWGELKQSDHAEMINWYCALIQLRRGTPALNIGEPGNVRVSYSEHKRAFIVYRGSINICCNLDKSDRAFPHTETNQILLSSHNSTRVADRRLILPPDTVAVVFDHAQDQK